MELDGIPEIFKTKLRLMIVSGLITGSKTFGELKAITGTTDGNLSVQISNLEKAGAVKVTKEFKGKKPLTTCELTALGFSEFKAYVEMLNDILKKAE